MPSYKAPVADTMFLLTDVFNLQRYENLPRFAEAPIDVVEAVLSEGGKLAEEVLQPLNLPGDQEGCKRLARRLGRHPQGFQRGLQGLRRRRLGGNLRLADLWRARASAFCLRRDQRICACGEPRVHDVSRP